MTTRPILNIVRLVLIILWATFSLATNAASFDLLFDSSAEDALLQPPILGIGGFGYTGVASDGVYSWDDLTDPTFAINFSGDTFTQNDIATPTSEILVIVFNSGTEVMFGNTNEFGSGPYGGSIDFQNFNNNDENELSFEPYDGTQPPPTTLLYFTDSYFADYGSPSQLALVPLPAALPLFLPPALGLMGLVGFRRKTTL